MNQNNFRTRFEPAQAALIDLVRPFDSEKMKAWRVDGRINKVRVNELSLSGPIKEEEIISKKMKATEKAKTLGQLGIFGAQR